LGVVLHDLLAIWNYTNLIQWKKVHLDSTKYVSETVNPSKFQSEHKRPVDNQAIKRKPAETLFFTPFYNLLKSRSNYGEPKKSKDFYQLWQNVQKC